MRTAAIVLQFSLCGQEMLPRRAWQLYQDKEALNRYRRDFGGLVRSGAWIFNHASSIPESGYMSVGKKLIAIFSPLGNLRQSN